jgi:Na+/H+ antiporter NhaA
LGGLQFIIVSKEKITLVNKKTMSTKLEWIRFGIFVTAVVVAAVGIYLIQVDNANPTTETNTGIIVTSIGGAGIGCVMISWIVQYLKYISRTNDIPKQNSQQTKGIVN